MRNTIDSILKAVTEFFAKLSKKEKIRLGVLAAVIIALAIVVTAVLGRTTYATLYSGLDAATAGQITTELTAMGISYKMDGTSTILIPEDSVNQVRVQLASMGYFSGGFDYSIWDSAGGFGTSDSELQAYKAMQLEANLRQQLLKLDKVKDCLVKLNLPESTSFVLSSKQEQASASVTLELVSGAALTDSDVEGIAYTIAGGAAIPVENIYIVDTNAKLYTVGGSSSGSTNLSYQLELENQVRSQLETQVTSLLATVFGSGRVKASVGVTLNFDKETVQSIEFAPPVEGSEEGLVISMSEVYEYTRDADAEGVVGTDSNGIGTVEYPYGDDGENDYYYIAREFNYEINQTVTELEKAQATIKSLSIAVLIDSEAIAEDYTANVKSLVVSAIGVGENYVAVERLPFQTDSDSFASAVAAQEAALKAAQRSDLIQTIIKGVIILLLAVAVLSFLRTVINGFTRQQPALAAASIGGDSTISGIDYLAGDNLGESPLDDVDLSGKSDDIVQLEKFIDKDSSVIAQLLRNWLSDED